MDSSFFSSYWNAPSRRPRYSANSPSVRGITVQRETTPSPRVVSIPVHFVNSERSRSDSAVKIQKAFRGFLVRKSVKRIEAIRREVEEIEKRISNKETADLIRRDSKERLKVNEMLMNVLFRLDSVRGVDSGVRDCRKAVIKKAIALQERVDAVQEVAKSENTDTVAEVLDQNQEIKELAECLEDHEEGADQNLEEQGKAPKVEDSASNFADNCNSLTNAVDQSLELHNFVEPISNLSESGVLRDVESIPNSMQVQEQSVDTAHGNEEKVELSEVGEIYELNTNEDKEIVEDNNATPSITEGFAESVGTSQGESQSDSSANPQSLIEGGEDNASGKQEELMEVHQPDQKGGNVKENSGAGGREENKRNRELLDRMMEDNEKMMGLMAELFERNEMQTRLLSSLSQRVEQLERAFVCERLRRKKKRDAAGPVDSSGTLPDTRKCGKR